MGQEQKQSVGIGTSSTKESRKGLDVPITRACEKFAWAHLYSWFILHSHTCTEIRTHPFLSLGSSLAYGISTAAGTKTNVGL